MDPNVFQLRKNWKLIAQEARQMMMKLEKQATVSTRPKLWDDVSNLKSKKQLDVRGQWLCGPAGGNGWLNYGLIVDDAPIPENCNECIWTYRLLMESGLRVKVAGFSWLRPHASIPEHQDPNDETVYHLGLIVPSGDRCYIRTQGQKLIHREAEVLTFDDRYLHSAHNETDEERVILYLLLHAP
jgi:hypothetical protein